MTSTAFATAGSREPVLAQATARIAHDRKAAEARRREP